MKGTNKINEIIKKLNKTTLFAILILYIIALGGILTLIGRNAKFYVEPEYNHIVYNDVITPQISVYTAYTYTDANVQNIKYNINPNITARLINGVNPGYSITNFRMSASTAKTVTSSASEMYNFTEYSTYKTDITHSFSIDCSNTQQHPTKFFARIQYVKDKETKIDSFMEEYWLQPTADDINKLNAWYDLNVTDSGSEKPINALLIKSPSDTTAGQTGNLQYILTPVASSTKKDYTLGARITVNNKTVTPYHIDMQTWLLNEDGDYLPFVGVYNHTSPTSTYSQSSREIDHRLKAKYICAKLVYMRVATDDAGNKIVGADGNIKMKESATFYFKQNIENIQSTYQSTPNAGQDINPDDIPTSNNLWIIVGGVGGGILIIMSLIGVISIVNNTKKKKEEMN